MLLKEIVDKFGQQVIGVGVLVEYQHSIDSQKVLGRLLGRRCGCRGAEHEVRAASVVLLIEKQGECEAEPLSAFSIILESGKRIESVSEKVDECHFDMQYREIEICEMQDDRQFAKVQFSNFFILNLSEQTTNLLELVEYTKDTMNKLAEYNVDVENLKFLATCGDLEWLAARYPKYVPEPLNERVMEVQKDEAEADIGIIENDIKYIKSELVNRQNDLLEAKDRAKPQWRWLWSFLGNPIIHATGRICLFILAVLAVGFAFGISDYFGNSIVESASTFAGVIVFLVIVVNIFRYYKTLLQWLDRFFVRHRCIEESRIRQAEERFQNP